jgi:hypothetical protein
MGTTVSVASFRDLRWGHVLRRKQLHDLLGSNARLEDDPVDVARSQDAPEQVGHPRLCVTADRRGFPVVNKADRLHVLTQSRVAHEDLVETRERAWTTTVERDVG